ncbi:hypothetical protein IAT40_005838 [Kwoniella sp. CBS 6097]
MVLRHSSLSWKHRRGAMSGHKPNLPLIFVSALTLKLLGGFAVGASALAVELPRLLGISEALSVWPLGAVCLGLACGLFISGPFYLRYHARTTCLVGAGLWGLGVFCGARSLSVGRYDLFLLSYGVGGVGMGLNYQSIVALMGQHFPSTPLATSTIGPFGSAIGISLFFLQAATFQFNTLSLARISRILTLAGIGVISISYVASRGIPRPPPGLRVLPPPPSRPSIRTARWQLGALLFANTLPGMTLLGVIIPLMNGFGVGKTITQTEYIIAGSTLALFLGGLSVSTLVRTMGPSATFSTLFMLRGVLLGLLSFRPSILLAMATFASVLFSHGAGFGMIPVLVRRQDELPRFPINSGHVLAGWGIAGFAGAVLNSYSVSVTGGLGFTLSALAAISGATGLVLQISKPVILA